MTKAAWIRPKLSPDKLTGRAEIHGLDVRVEISPYYFPDVFRAFYVPERGVFRIEFRYIDQERTERMRFDECISFEVGKHSGKLLSIECAVDKHGLDVVRLDLQRALDRADRGVKDLQMQASDVGKRLNYSAVDQVLQVHRDDPELIGAAV